MLDIPKELSKLDYLVTVSKMGEHLFQADYPERYFPFPVFGLTEQFYIETGAGIKIKNNSKEPIFVEMSDYIGRLFIVSKVLHRCRHILQYDKENIMCFDLGGERVSLSELCTTIPLKEEDQAKESALAGIYIKGVLNGFPDDYRVFAEQDGVLDGYTILQKVYRGEL